MTDRDEVKAAFTVLRAAYPRWAQQQDRDTARAWRSLLDDVPTGKLIAAVIALARSSQWPPTIAEIREAAGCEEPGAAERRAAAAASAAERDAWVAEQERRATARARRVLEALGIEATLVPVAELLRRVGR